MCGIVGGHKGILWLYVLACVFYEGDAFVGPKVFPHTSRNTNGDRRQSQFLGISINANEASGSTNTPPPSSSSSSPSSSSSAASSSSETISILMDLNRFDEIFSQASGGLLHTDSSATYVLEESLADNAQEAATISAALPSSTSDLPVAIAKGFNVAHDNNNTIAVCPSLVTLESLRAKYGARKSWWGEWSDAEARKFYKQLLPRALQIDGALGLSLEERARLAAEARHSLRLYVRDRQRLPGRLVARLYDGLRHLVDFGSWSSNGMTWEEVKQKYTREAREELGDLAMEEDLQLFVYRRIVDRACVTNALFDQLAEEGTLQALGRKISQPNWAVIRFLQRKARLHFGTNTETIRERAINEATLFVLLRSQRPIVNLLQSKKQVSLTFMKPSALMGDAPFPLFNKLGQLISTVFRER